MKITLFMLSEGTMHDQNGKLMIGTPVMFFSFPAFPAMFSFSVIFGVQDVDLNATHNMTFEVYDPSGNQIAGQSIAIPPNNQPSTNEDGITSLVASLDIRNFLFRSKGVYKFKFSFDDLSVEKEYIVTKQIDT